VDENERRDACAGKRHVHTQAARGRLAPQLLANRTRGAEQPAEAAHVDRYKVVAVPFVARGEIGGKRHERVRGV